MLTEVSTHMSVNIPYNTQDLKLSVTLALPYTRILGGFIL